MAITFAYWISREIHVRKKLDPSLPTEYYKNCKNRIEFLIWQLKHPCFIVQLNDQARFASELLKMSESR